MMSGVGRRMGALDGVEIVEVKGHFGVNVEHPIVTNGILCVRGGDASGVPSRITFGFLVFVLSTSV